jgi:co-chaperonin GroES (HSP10)
MPAMVMAHETDPAQVLLDKLGVLDAFELFNNQVLCAVYQRPEKTSTGIYLTDAVRDEDRSQGKVGLIVKMGSAAFDDPTGRWGFADMELHDWVFYRASDGWAVTVNGVLCRILDDTNVRGRIQSPDDVW